MLEHENVHRIGLGDREIILIGTAHVSRESAALVERGIEEEKPDTVCVELCRPRFEAIRQRDKWQQTDIIKVIREKRTSILLSQLLMASMQRKIAKKFNITPGEEMLRAIECAEAVGAELVLADREIRVTLLRTWRKMGVWGKGKFLPDVFLSLFATDEITEEEIEKLKQHDMLELALQTIGEKLPGVKATLIDERDLYLAHTIGHAPGAKIVAVVGAGHVPGIQRHLGEEIAIDALADTIIAMTGSQSPKQYLSYEQAYGRPFDDMMCRVPCLDRIRNITGFVPKTSLDSTLRLIIEDQKRRLGL